MKLPVPPDADLPSISFYGDASSRQREYMVVGGFAVNGSRIAEIEDRIAAIKAEVGMKSEFHFADYRGGRKQRAYENLVRYAFELIERRQAALHVVIAKFGNLDQNDEIRETRDTRINKLYFQLCLHRLAQFYGARRKIHVRLDAGNDSVDICSMRNQLCAAAYRQYQTLPNCFRSIEPVCSGSVGLIQMTDVLIGAIAAKRNDVQHASKKGDLANFVLRMSGRGSWTEDTTRDARFLTVWHHIHKAAGPPAS